MDGRTRPQAHIKGIHMAGLYKVPVKWVGNMKAIVNHEELAEVLMRDRRSSGAKVPVAFLHTLLNPHIHPEPGL